ncbi:hypothetical protein ES703_115048 [subsurface metagenome]
MRRIRWIKVVKARRIRARVSLRDSSGRIWPVNVMKRSGAALMRRLRHLAMRRGAQWLQVQRLQVMATTTKVLPSGLVPRSAPRLHCGRCEAMRATSCAPTAGGSGGNGEGPGVRAGGRSRTCVSAGASVGDGSIPGLLAGGFSRRTPGALERRRRSSASPSPFTGGHGTREGGGRQSYFLPQGRGSGAGGESSRFGGDRGEIGRGAPDVGELMRLVAIRRAEPSLGRRETTTRARQCQRKSGGERAGEVWVFRPRFLAQAKYGGTGGGPQLVKAGKGGSTVSERALN